MIELREQLYYLRQYHAYDRAGMVPHVRCDLCDYPYYPRVEGDDVYLWCMFDDVRVSPGLGLIYKMKEHVERIESDDPKWFRRYAG